MQKDRAVEALEDIGVYGPADAIVAIVLRVIRDDLAMAELHGQVYGLPDVEKYLNDRIDALTRAAKTTTGDTTIKGFAGYR